MTSETTVVLVAAEGEWTRRRVDGPKGARKLGRSLRIPVYDVQIIGYPQRMRDYNARQRVLPGRLTCPTYRLKLIVSIRRFGSRDGAWLGIQRHAVPDRVLDANRAE